MPNATDEVDSTGISAPKVAPTDDISAWRDVMARAQKAQESEDWTAAQMAWLEAIRLRPDDARAHANLATLLWRQGKGGDALPHIERAMELDDRYKKQFAPLHQMLMRARKSPQSKPPGQ
jgi:Tfp pilus assembly protein PilF